MLPKPTHLETRYGDQFQNASIVAAYHYRPPYPAALFEKLVGLIGEAPIKVLDAGCGTGDIARPLATLVERVDAVDVSRLMLEKGRGLPDGDRPNLRWILGPMETVELDPPYTLVTAGESLHWMDWSVVLPRFRQLLTQQGYLVIIGRAELANPWRDDLQPLINRFTTNKDYQPHNLVEELEKRNLFVQQGAFQSEPVNFSQPLDDYIEAIHSRNGFSRDRMTVEDAATFDNEYKKLLLPFSQEGRISLQIVGSLTWGKPA